MSNLKLVKPATEAEKTTRTTLDVFEVTPKILQSWKLPPFQRPLKQNPKVIAIAEEIKQDDGVIPGVLTVGVLDGDRYLIDGQHRREAFMLSECQVGYVDVRTAHYKTMKEMADEFIQLNSSIVKMKPDDHLRAMESSYPVMAKLRKHCAFVGYDNIRRGDRSPILSAATTIRSWNMSSKEVPAGGGHGSAVDVLKAMSEDDVDQLIAFLNLAVPAWGKDPEYARLWGGLNMTICMWLYRRTVIAPMSVKVQKITPTMFQKCLAALSADSLYLDWLVNRQLTDKNRSPCYKRMKEIIAKRLHQETGVKPFLPAPAWSTHA